jgi:hypothetical protein
VTADQDNVPEPHPPTEPTDEPTAEPAGTAGTHPRRNRWLLLLVFIVILIVILLAKYGFDTLFKGLSVFVSYLSLVPDGND